MLWSKKLKAAAVAFVGIVGVCGGLSAHAAINLSSAATYPGDPGAGHDVVVYAAETVTADSKSFTTPKATPNSLMVTADLDSALPGANNYIRLDLEPLSGTSGVIQFAATPVVNMDGSPMELQYKGAAGDTSGVWATGTVTLANGVVTTNLGQDADTTGDSPVNQTALVKIRGNAGDKFVLRLRAYDNFAQARNSGALPFSEFAKPIIAVDRTLMVEIKNANTLTADVASGFTQLLPEDADDDNAATTATGGELAHVVVSVTKGHDPDGARGPREAWPIWSADEGGGVVAVGDVMKSGAVDITGDFSVGTFAVSGASMMLINASNEELEKDDKGKYTDPSSAVKATFGLAVAEGPKPFTLNVKDNEDPIPVGRYMGVTSASPALVGAGSIPNSKSTSAGNIDRNGTTVHLGYLTTYEGHNQRLVIVNRGAREAMFELTDIVTEDGTMAEAGKMAMGMVGAGESKVIQVRDLVSFAEGGTTRAAATLLMSAEPKDVSVATTLVNTMDRSTDTVSYEPE